MQSLSSLGGPGTNADIKDVARSARDRNAAMNIQSQSNNTHNN
jgi:hypothetical protein